MQFEVRAPKCRGRMYPTPSLLLLLLLLLLLATALPQCTAKARTAAGPSAAATGRTRTRTAAGHGQLHAAAQPRDLDRPVAAVPTQAASTAMGSPDPAWPAPCSPLWPGKPTERGCWGWDWQFSFHPVASKGRQRVTCLERRQRAVARGLVAV